MSHQSALGRSSTPCISLSCCRHRSLVLSVHIAIVEIYPAFRISHFFDTCYRRLVTSVAVCRTLPGSPLFHSVCSSVPFCCKGLRYRCDRPACPGRYTGYPCLVGVPTLFVRKPCWYQVASGPCALFPGTPADCQLCFLASTIFLSRSSKRSSENQTT